MPAPLVALVSYHLDLGRVDKWDTGAYAVPDEYVAATSRAGGRASVLAGPSDDHPDALLQRFDGLLLVGGGDVAPERFGSNQRHPDVYGVDTERDDLEVGLIMAADRMGLPTLAICRGIQVLNVALGGTLHQHLPDVEGFDQHRLPAKVGFMHEVKVSEGSRVSEATGAAALQCYSAHHQGLDRLGEGLVPVGWAEDGLVEAIERQDGWMVGVQWHPERTAAQDPSQQALFDALVARARAGVDARR
jgi:putative glutamine amidotransferase